MKDTQRSWEKRLSSKPDELTVDYVESLSYDKRLYKYDVIGSMAHAAMLAAQGFITQAELEAIGKGLAGDNGVDNQELIAVNAAIRNHPVEIVGRTLRSHMTAMKKIV